VSAVRTPGTRGEAASRGWDGGAGANPSRPTNEEGNGTDTGKKIGSSAGFRPTGLRGSRFDESLKRTTSRRMFDETERPDWWNTEHLSSNSLYIRLLFGNYIFRLRFIYFFVL
jgi:hypothetical protein